MNMLNCYLVDGIHYPQNRGHFLFIAAKHKGYLILHIIAGCVLHNPGIVESYFRVETDHVVSKLQNFSK